MFLIGSDPNVSDPWAAYVPDADNPWNRRRVVHLHRRAGFGATWAEIERDLSDGPARSVDRLLSGQSRCTGVPDDFGSIADRLAALAIQSHSSIRLKGWWIYRMLFGPDPLTERLTLLWHNHFATSNLKVDNLALMYRQNQTMRSLGRAPFGRLLKAMLRDPALLIWLDSPENTKGHPNENLGRELLELFTLGIGNYSEADVKNSSRALTGWRMVGEEATFVASRHDSGRKSILDHTENFDADALAAVLVAHPATSRRLAWRLCQEFFGENVVDGRAMDALAAGLRAHNLDIGWAVETIVRSRLFFATANLGSRVSSPTEFTVSSARALEILNPAPSTPVLADWCARLGQDLFYPPNVGGWLGGRSWITTRSAIGRANFAGAIMEGESVGLASPFDASALAARHGMKGDPRFYARLVLGGDQPEVPLAGATQSRQALARLLSSPSALRV
jgi:uncharacterized protein (DUF1800 family)